MLKRWVSVALCVVAGCVSSSTIQGSGVSKTETRLVPGFASVSTTGSMALEVKQGPEFTVEVMADDNLLPLILTRVVGSTLEIGSEQSFSSRRPIVVRITMPQLERVVLTGSGSLLATGISSTSLRLDLTGSGSARLEGQVDEFQVNVMGSGSVDGSTLEAGSVRVLIAGSGSVQVTAADRLTARVTGSGTVVYAGSPAHVDQQATGSGRVRAR